MLLFSKTNRIFGIPIGVLGAGFEEIVGRENKDDAEELRRAASSSEEDANADTSNNRSSSSSSTTNNTNTNQSIERAAYNFVNGLGSSAAQQFELTIYGLIFLAVAVGCWQTVEGQQNAFSEIEWFAVIVFTIEYIIRLVGVGADPLFAPSPMNRLNWFTCRLRFMISFYSIIDLLAIVPFYLTVALPNSIVNDYDEYLRMLRIIRLVKLDKYVPSITLVGKSFSETVCLSFPTILLMF